jgi:hypothetical protein
VIKSEKSSLRPIERGSDGQRDSERTFLDTAQMSIKRERERMRDGKSNYVSGSVSVNMLIGADTSKALADFSKRLADHIAHTANTGDTWDRVFYVSPFACTRNLFGEHTALFLFCFTICTSLYFPPPSLSPSLLYSAIERLSSLSHSLTISFSV